MSRTGGYVLTCPLEIKLWQCRMGKLSMKGGLKLPPLIDYQRVLKFLKSHRYRSRIWSPGMSWCLKLCKWSPSAHVHCRQPHPPSSRHCWRNSWTQSSAPQPSNMKVVSNDSGRGHSQQLGIPQVMNPVFVAEITSLMRNFGKIFVAVVSKA